MSSKELDVSTESQIGLGDGVEVEVGDHVDKVEVYKVLDLELDLEEGELDLACVESIVLRKTGEEVHVTSTNSMDRWNRRIPWGSRGVFVSPL